MHPPVDIDAFAPVAPVEVDDCFLMVGELVRYKPPDIAMHVFNRTRRRLVVIGDGEMPAELRRFAGPTAEILRSQPFAQLRHHYARARGLIFPGEEDSGIVPVEAMARGRPVVGGGATETVVDGRTGVFIDEQSEEALIDAISRLGRLSLNSADIALYGHWLNPARFERHMREAVSEAWMQVHGQPLRLSGPAAGGGGAVLPSRRKPAYA